MVRRPSVVVHFFKLEYLWSQLANLDQSKKISNDFMCSITGMGERLHKVLGQIGSKLWFQWQQKAPIDLYWGKRCLHLFSVVFDPILFILAGNEDMYKISDEFEFRPDRTTAYGVSCTWASKKFHRLIMGKCCLHASSFIFDRIIIKVASYLDRHKSSDEFDFGPDQTTHFEWRKFYTFELEYRWGQ